MDGVEILAEEYPRFVGLDSNDVHALLKYLVPDCLCITPQRRHVYLIVYITDAVHE